MKDIITFGPDNLDILNEHEYLAHLPHCPTYADVITKTNEAFQKRFGSGNALAEWQDNSRKLGEMSPKQIAAEKLDIVPAVLKKTFPKTDRKSKMMKKIFSVVLKATGKASVLDMSHLGEDLNVFCITLPKYFYEHFTKAASNSVPQGFATHLPPLSKTIFDMVSISCSEVIGSGMPPAQTQLHEAAHSVDILSQFRKKGEAKLIGEMVALFGEHAVPEKQNTAMIFDRDYFISYVDSELAEQQPEKLLALLNITRDELVTEKLISQRMAQFVHAISTKVNRRDMTLLLMHSQSFDEVYEGLKTRLPHLFSADGYFIQ